MTEEKALDKQKIAKLIDRGNGIVMCPSCDTYFWVDVNHYDQCPNCGQALDWSDVHD